MNVLFIYYDVNSSEPARYACGIGSLSSYIKKFGHTTDLVYFKSYSDLDSVYEKLDTQHFDIIAISATTSGFSTVNRMVLSIRNKYHEAFIILGGSHVSILPDSINEIEGVDGVCVGYGEEPLLRLLEKMKEGKSYLKTPNFWFKENGEVIKNDKLEFPRDWDPYFDFDRELFDKELFRLNKTPYYFSRGLLGNKVFEYICCRGCPYSCTFCAAPLIKTWGVGKGWINFPSPRRVIDKIKADVEKYNLTGVAFHDDVFTFNKRWFLEFARLYHKEINLPYACNSRVGVMEEEIADALIMSNCKLIITGIESGNDFIRLNVANRNISKEKIIESLGHLKNNDILIGINNMIGFPNETFDQFMDTIELNADVNPYRSNASVFYPYPGTSLFDYCVKNKLISIDNNGQIIERNETILRFADFPHEQIIRISKVFHLLVMYQRFINKVFGKNSILSLRYTEPLMSRVSQLFLSVYLVLRKYI